MSRCVYSLEDFDSSDKEHFLQNFLGARWTSDTIVCNELQIEFGRTIDVGLEKGLQVVRNLLGTQGGRGGEGPVLKGLPASSGEVLDLEPGGHPRLNRPTIQEQQIQPGKTKVNLRAGNINQLNWAISRIRRQYPDAHISTADVLQSAETVEGFVGGVIQLSLQFGGDEYFRGMLKSCFNLFAVSYPQEVFRDCFEPLRNFVRTGSDSSERFVRWTSNGDRLELPQLGNCDQGVFIVSRGQSVEGMVRFFGEITHPFQLTDSYDGPPIHCGYLVDPFREAQPAEDRAPIFGQARIPEFALQELSYSDSASTALVAQLGRIMEQHFSRSRANMIEGVIKEVIGEYGGETLTSEMVHEIATRLAHKALRLPLRKPNRSQDPPS